MHGRWSIPVRLRVNRWSLIILVIVFAASTSAMPPRTSSIALNRIWEEDEDARAELETIKERILADLGLSKVPDVSKANISEEHMNDMLKLYRRSVMENEREEIENEKSVLRLYSYTGTASSENTTFHANNNSDFEKVLFPLQSATIRWKGHQLQSAKLRIPIEQGWSNPSVHIYRLLEDSSSPNSSQALVINQIVDTISPTYIQVDIVDTVRLWIDNPKLNFGLLLECQRCWNVSDRSQIFGESPILDVLVSELPTRVKRSNRIRPDTLGLTGLDCTKGLRTKRCCRRSLTVSFEDIGWNWILQPESFEAYYCKGKCHFKSNIFATTHSLVQSILSRKNRKVPKPCCAPKRLRPLSLLHYNDDGNELVVTRQKGMIVTECACS